MRNRHAPPGHHWDGIGERRPCRRSRSPRRPTRRRRRRPAAGCGGWLKPGTAQPPPSPPHSPPPPARARARERARERARPRVVWCPPRLRRPRRAPAPHTRVPHTPHPPPSGSRRRLPPTPHTPTPHTPPPPPPRDRPRRASSRDRAGARAAGELGASSAAPVCGPPATATGSSASARARAGHAAPRAGPAAAAARASRALGFGPARPFSQQTPAARTRARVRDAARRALGEPSGNRAKPQPARANSPPDATSPRVCALIQTPNLPQSWRDSFASRRTAPASTQRISSQFTFRTIRGARPTTGVMARFSPRFRSFFGRFGGGER